MKSDIPTPPRNSGKILQFAQPEGQSLKSGGGGGTFDGMDIKDRVKKLEDNHVTFGMDLAFIRGRTEDAPTKDWVNDKLNKQTGILLSVIAVGVAILAALIALN